MILFQNSLITLTYEPGTDILVVTWSNRLPLNSVELQGTMHKVIEAINKFHCNNIMIDASNAITQLDDIDFRASLGGFIAELGHTNIQKLARIHTPYPAREEKFNYLQHELAFPFQMKDFGNVEDAIKWLSQGKEPKGKVDPQ